MPDTVSKPNFFQRLFGAPAIKQNSQAQKAAYLRQQFTQETNAKGKITILPDGHPRNPFASIFEQHQHKNLPEYVQANTETLARQNPDAFASIPTNIIQNYLTPSATHLDPLSPRQFRSLITTFNFTPQSVLLITGALLEDDVTCGEKLRNAARDAGLPGGHALIQAVIIPPEEPRHEQLPIEVALQLVDRSRTEPLGLTPRQTAYVATHLRMEADELLSDAYGITLAPAESSSETYTAKDTEPDKEPAQPKAQPEASTAAPAEADTDMHEAYLNAISQIHGSIARAQAATQQLEAQDPLKYKTISARSFKAWSKAQPEAPDTRYLAHSRRQVQTLQEILGWTPEQAISFFHLPPAHIKQYLAEEPTLEDEAPIVAYLWAMGLTYGQLFDASEALHHKNPTKHQTLTKSMLNAYLRIKTNKRFFTPEEKRRIIVAAKRARQTLEAKHAKENRAGPLTPSPSNPTKTKNTTTTAAPPSIHQLFKTSLTSAFPNTEAAALQSRRLQAADCRKHEAISSTMLDRWMERQPSNNQRYVRTTKRQIKTLQRMLNWTDQQTISFFQLPEEHAQQYPLERPALPSAPPISGFLWAEELTRAELLKAAIELHEQNPEKYIRISKGALFNRRQNQEFDSVVTQLILAAVRHAKHQRSN